METEQKDHRLQGRDGYRAETDWPPFDPEADMEPGLYLLATPSASPMTALLDDDDWYPEEREPGEGWHYMGPFADPPRSKP